MADLFDYSICIQINKSNFEKLMPSGCWAKYHSLILVSEEFIIGGHRSAYFWVQRPTSTQGIGI